MLEGIYYYRGRKEATGWSTRSAVSALLTWVCGSVAIYCSALCPRLSVVTFRLLYFRVTCTCVIDLRNRRQLWN